MSGASVGLFQEVIPDLPRIDAHLRDVGLSSKSASEQDAALIAALDMLCANLKHAASNNQLWTAVASSGRTVRARLGAKARELLETDHLVKYALPRVGAELEKAGWPIPPPAATVLSDMAEAVDSAGTALRRAEHRVQVARQNVAEGADIACQLHDSYASLAAKNTSDTADARSRRAAVKGWAKKGRNLLAALALTAGLVVDVPEATSSLSEAGRAAVEAIATSEVVVRADDLWGSTVDELLSR